MARVDASGRFAFAGLTACDQHHLRRAASRRKQHGSPQRAICFGSRRARVERHQLAGLELAQSRQLRTFGNCFVLACVFAASLRAELALIAGITPSAGSCT